MWFSNVRFYPLDADFEWGDVESAVKKSAFVPIGPAEARRVGWVAPSGGGPLVYSALKAHLLCLVTEEKILPASAINRLVQSAADELERKENRKVNRRERKLMKEAIVTDRLPKALTRVRKTFGYYDEQLRMLVIDAASEKVADAFIFQLRRDLFSLPALVPVCSDRPEDKLRAWAEGLEMPVGVTVGNAIDLWMADGTVKFRNWEVHSREVWDSISGGAEVSSLALSFDERLSFVLDSTLALRRMKPLGMLKKEVEQAEDPLAQFDAEFCLQVGEFRQLIPAVCRWLGGLKDLKDL